MTNLLSKMGLSRTMAKASSFDDLQMLVSLEDPWIVLILNMSTGHVDKKLNFSERTSKYLMQHIFYLTIKSYIINTFLDVMIIMTLKRKSWHFILWPVMQPSLASQNSWIVLNIVCEANSTSSASNSCHMLLSVE